MQPDELAALRRERFGFIFQRYNLLSSLTARDNVALPAVYMGMDSKERAERAEKLLGDLGLQNKEGNKPSELSGGQQQRVSIARALMNGGEIILPTSRPAHWIPPAVKRDGNHPQAARRRAYRDYGYPRSGHCGKRKPRHRNPRRSDYFGYV